MIDLPKSFEIDTESGYMDKTFSMRLPRKCEHMLEQMTARGFRVGPKIRPYVAEMIETLYRDWNEKQKQSVDV